MTREQIDELISAGVFPESTKQRKLIVTHISWVILCDRFVYKIKKPIRYSFLNFSTIEHRKYFCERELELNRRFADNIYLEVLPIHHFQFEDRYRIGGKKGSTIDYCLKMYKLDPKKQMDVLLSKNKVIASDIRNLARCIADFHKDATIIFEKNVTDAREKFNDLLLEKEFLTKNLKEDCAYRIDQAVEKSQVFLHKNEKLLEKRLRDGLFRDCHGDLHTKNIFLLPKPQPFDCIEFNDDYRQIDVLNEVAFLCMDLDALGRKDLSSIFIEHYNQLFPAIKSKNDQQLFRYYKSYRANVRAKVNCLRAKSASDEVTKGKALSEAGKYLKLMESYLSAFSSRKSEMC